MKWASNGDVEALKRFISVGAKVNKFNSRLDTALMMSDWNGHVETIKVLIEAVANLNHARTTYGKTSLMGASFKGHVESIRTLKFAKENSSYEVVAIVEDACAKK